eukprot:6481585-Amphidinium_carterae.1
MRPRQLDHLQRGMTSYQFMLQMDRGLISDSDDDCLYPRYTIFADRMGNEYTAMSRKRCNVCRNSDYPVVLSQCILCKHHVHGKPGSNQEFRFGQPEPDIPNRYPRCGGVTTVGGDMLCLRCARNHSWIQTENWCVDRQYLGRHWTDVFDAIHQEYDEAPYVPLTRAQLDAMHPEDRRQMDPDASDASSLHHCWYPGCSVAGLRICE